MTVRDVVVVVYPDVNGVDVMGPLEVFAKANKLGGTDYYRVRVAAVSAEPVTTTSGAAIVVETALHDIAGRVDTLVVAGGDGTYQAVGNERLLAQIVRLASGARRVASVCSGAFLLARVGLLVGRRATTHWEVAHLLDELFPSVIVEADPIYVRDGNVWTSAGVTAGMDLALALVEEDLGRDIALAIARHLVLFLRRPANQSQFSAQLATQLADREPIRDVQSYVVDQPGADLRVTSMARLASMSPRHFARCFTAEVGVTPARYVERVRLEAARRRLEESDDAVELVAATCGFGTAETLRRTFLRSLRTTPTEYRRRFRAA